MTTLSRRVSTLERGSSRCQTCVERGRRFFQSGGVVPDRCPACGVDVVPFHFTIIIDRAGATEAM